MGHTGALSQGRKNCVFGAKSAAGATGEPVRSGRARWKCTGFAFYSKCKEEPLEGCKLKSDVVHLFYLFNYSSHSTLFY